MTNRARVTVCVAAALLLPGCARQLNERPALGNAVRTTTLRPAAWATPPAESPDRSAPVAATLDRSAWPAHVFLVPVDGTVHGPLRHRDIALTRDSRRQQGLFPTIESSLDLEGDAGGAMALEGVLAPFSATLELALMPVSLIVEPPFKDAQSPAWLSKRTPRHVWSSAPMSEPAR